jgi:hypothetical protein
MDEHGEFLDTLLLRLAEAYESRQRFGIPLVDATPVEKEVVAKLRAEGSVSDDARGLRFTDAGYDKYKSRIVALRALPKANSDTST